MQPYPCQSGCRFWKWCCECGESSCSLASRSPLSSTSIHHSSELFSPYRVWIMEFPRIKISYPCLWNNTQALQWLIRRSSPSGCHSTVSCLLPFLPCSHSYPGLPWTRCSMLSWFFLPGRPFSTPGPTCEVNLWDSVQASLALSFSVVIPPTLPKKNPFPSIFPQHLHTLHPLLSSLSGIAFCFVSASLLVECEFHNDSVVP